LDIRKLQKAIVDGLEDVKAQDIRVFDTEHLSPLFERVIVASGTSNRQTKALAASVRDTVKSRGMEVLATEGEENGEWIIVDCGAAVAHIMQPAIRIYYHLEEIWGIKPVKSAKGASRKAAPAPRAMVSSDALDDVMPAAKVKPAARSVSKSASDKAPLRPARRTVSTSAAQGSAKAIKPKAGVSKATSSTVASKATPNTVASKAAPHTAASKAAPSKTSAAKTSGATTAKRLAKAAPAKKAPRAKAPSTAAKQKPAR
jgi:ribosome-associated protein